MTGGHQKYRHLSRSSSHRQALLRNLVTSLFKHESIATTWHKAKEAQRLAEQLVTLGKKNTEATRRRATQIFFEPNEMVPKLFGPIRERYASRPGGYTRVLRVEPLKEDQAESAILELVDGPRDLRFAMTAKTLANTPKTKQFNQRTAENVRKVTRFRENGVETLQAMVERMRIAKEKGIDNRVLPAPQKVYPEEKAKRQMHYFEETDNYRLPNKIVRLPFQPKDGKAWGTNKKAAYKKKFGITVKSRVEMATPPRAGKRTPSVAEKATPPRAEKATPPRAEKSTQPRAQAA